MAKEKLRVLQVLTALGVGGAETWMMALLRHFKDHEDTLPYQVQMDFCLTGGYESVFDREATVLGAKLFYVKYSRRALSSFTREFRKILKTNQYDAVHDHQDYAAAPHFLAGLGLLPSVRAVHVHNPLFFPARFASQPARACIVETEKQGLARLATHILGTSREILSVYGFDRRVFRHLPREAAHCGFDTDAFALDRRQSRKKLLAELKLGERAKVLLFVGRLGPDDALGKEVNQKNPKFALEVARELVQCDQNYHLLLAGGGQRQRQLFEAQTVDWGIHENIHFLGIRHDIPQLMTGSDLLLFPSRAEGLGMVAVEAQASGLPVLTSDTTPRECQVVNEMVRFLPLGDGPARWANEARSITDQSLPDHQPCNHAVVNSGFSIRNSAAKLLEVYSGKRASNQVA